LPDADVSHGSARISGDACSLVGGSLAAVSRALSRQVDHALNDLDLTADTCYLLDLIVQHDGIAMNDLARRLAIPAPTLTKLVDRLASKALVFRLVDHTDRRRTLVHASLRGSEVHATASQRAREIEARFMAELGWSDAQLNALQALNAPEDH